MRNNAGLSQTASERLLQHTYIYIYIYRGSLTGERAGNIVRHGDRKHKCPFEFLCKGRKPSQHKNGANNKSGKTEMTPSRARRKPIKCQVSMPKMRTRFVKEKCLHCSRSSPPFGQAGSPRSPHAEGASLCTARPHCWYLSAVQGGQDGHGAGRV